MLSHENKYCVSNEVKQNSEWLLLELKQYLKVVEEDKQDHNNLLARPFPPVTLMPDKEATS